MPNKDELEEMVKPVYLGDGLYAEFDGFQIELFASNGVMKTNRVFLEPNVLEAFERYVKDLRKKVKNAA
jgi:hypothetical protein